MPYFQLNEIQLYYETAGQGEPLFFLHGLGSSSRDWQLQVEHFAADYRVIACDVRGHGRSGKPREKYSIPQFAADLAELLRALDAAPAHIVGISMGGMIAFQMAVDAPELVRSLTIVNSAPELIIRTFRERLQLWQRLFIVRLLGMRKMGEVLAERLLPGAHHAESRQIFADRWAENDRRAYLSAMQALVGWSVSDRLDTISCPVLVIAGDQDYTPVAHKEAYTSRLKQAELTVIEDCRHAAPVEHPERFNEILAGFLQAK